MTKVKFLTRSASATGVIQIGDIVEIPDSEARLLITGGYAVSVEPPLEEGAEPPVVGIPSEEGKSKPKTTKRK